MSKVLTRNRLIHIAKANKVLIASWREGVSIERDSGHQIQRLINVVAVDRWKLAYEYKRHANRMVQSMPNFYRSAISRYYYAMYHAMRACAYIFHGGDDYEEHSKLPLNLPSDLPPGVDYQSILKSARLTRNRADYDPYPKLDKAWKSDALSIKVDAHQFLLISRTYLRSKGCIL